MAEITITAHQSEILFDNKEFMVKAGQTVQLTLVNQVDSVNLQPDNLLIIVAGTVQGVDMAANAEVAGFTFLSEQQAIPRSNYILHHTKLLKPGETETV